MVGSGVRDDHEPLGIATLVAFPRSASSNLEVHSMSQEKDPTKEEELHRDKPEGHSLEASGQDTEWQEEAGSPFEDPDEKKPTRGGCFSPLSILAVGAMFLVLGAILIPNFIRARSRGQLTACKSNLKNIGTAFEMYSTDWSGKYPSTIALLTPNYLKSIPECPAAGSVTYTIETGPKAAYNSHGFEDYYFVQCEGDNHIAVSVPKNYPQYDGISGLIER